ncbi:hypothetical protein FZ025_19815 [Xanthomonas hyacinthi]|uniref:Wadjet protein JetD C-terminal domain-containing protein n=1 Tax=Xanthomonas hyacinthi TaxID=56455 RepID=A0A2S7EPX0_9XANT|nr:Wadjet anti-phage system protein JetD domain-containing protein [Xanthomonas hyacinthi]KLD79109.1 hypothetical protein Y886_06370 [Xanthomonas hyacinthi DSM 19077]PPU95156.1 hypothetical protein XhyaCFBP1156_19675 [Xanthomonas hyacinthi]QGY78772.1 hypothetical protein FZ025_19815 [Xanthomonas hyacinthi]
MSWTRPVDLVAQVGKAWDSGTLLALLAGGKSPFPMRLRLRGPTSADLVDRFDDVRVWVAELQALPHIRIETRQFRHRVRGNTTLPNEAWVDTLDDALALIDRRNEVATFDAQVQQTRDRQPSLLGWLHKWPLRALALGAYWPRLLDVVDWMQAHPRPGLYLRQVDIPGVHSKFIERHLGVLSELLDAVLPESAIDTAASGVGGFNRRYGFAAKPERVRFRVLDPALSLLPGVTGGDVTLDVGSFRALRCNLTRVFITENETNFLAFPAVTGSLVLFGAGYGFDTLDGNDWLRQGQLYYWGDIDTHGFAILDQLRARLPEVQGFLMDRATLMACEPFWGREEHQLTRDLPRLRDEEYSLYDDLRDQRIRDNLRLEQEFIGFDRVHRALEALC